jgi:hypothetical protein
MENNTEVPQKKKRTPILSSNTTPMDIPKEISYNEDTGITMFIAALFTIAKLRK